MFVRFVLHIVFLFSCFTGSAQIFKNIEKSIDKDSILKILKASKVNLVRLSDTNHRKGVYLLNLAENLTDTMNDINLKILVNRHRLEYFIDIRDTVMAEEYLRKNLVLIEKVGDKRELGLHYERIGALRSFQKRRKEEEMAAFKTASELLNKYGEKRDLIEANYNLGVIY